MLLVPIYSIADLRLIKHNRRLKSSHVVPGHLLGHICRLDLELHLCYLGQQGDLVGAARGELAVLQQRVIFD